ncbi:hypothetical protein DFH09DRAFT_1286434 [Mycena vulgaris]|nr:hypothetical protein DFH09DRAFT_1286434 [Mycena vulgaris]
MNSRVGGVAESSISSRAEARVQISALDAQILELELALGALRHERKILQDELDSYTYPVLELPNEIVSEIFTHFLPLYPERPPLWGALSPFTLGQICRTWREIALATPSLWRAIRLDYPNQITDTLAGSLHLIENWLERSKASPLSIALDYYHKSAIAAAIDAVLAHRCRWAEVDLSIPFSDIVSVSSTPFPLLHTLALRSSDYFPGWGDPIMLFEQAPNLTNVTLPQDFDPFHVCLPWSQITTLRAMCLLEDEVIEILPLARNLVHCSIILESSGPGIDIPVIAPHMHLQDLTFTAKYVPLMSEMSIFDNLALPALRRLEVPEPWFAPNPGATIAAWISRSGCDLEQLHITHSKQSEIYYRNALPSVRNISTDYVPGFDASGFGDDYLTASGDTFCYRTFDRRQAEYKFCDGAPKLPLTRSSASEQIAVLNFWYTFGVHADNTSKYSASSKPYGQCFGFSVTSSKQSNGTLDSPPPATCLGFKTNADKMPDALARHQRRGVILIENWGQIWICGLFFSVPRKMTPKTMER